MKRTDLIKLAITRNWKMPAKERIAKWLKPSIDFKTQISGGIIWLKDEDIAIHTMANSYIEWTILCSGTYEEEINKLIRISLKSDDNALDIGCNIGLQSIRMSQSVGKSGRILSFEPLNYLREKLDLNLSLNKISNVFVFPYALSDSESEGDYTVDNTFWNQGAFTLSDIGDGTVKQHLVVKTGDKIPEVQNLETLALIKIDVEGFEYQVLKGLERTILKNRPRIILEYNSTYWGRTNQNILDCYSYFLSLEYLVYQITAVGCELIRDAKNITDGNLFCIPGKL